MGGQTHVDSPAVETPVQEETKKTVRAKYPGTVRSRNEAIGVLTLLAVEAGLINMNTIGNVGSEIEVTDGKVTKGDFLAHMCSDHTIAHLDLGLRIVDNKIVDNAGKELSKEEKITHLCSVTQLSEGLIKAIFFGEDHKIVLTPEQISTIASVMGAEESQIEATVELIGSQVDVAGPLSFQQVLHDILNHTTLLVIGGAIEIANK